MFSPSRLRQLRPRTHQFKDLYPANPEHSREFNREYSPESSLFRPTPINPSAWLPNKDSPKGCNLSIPLALIRTTGDRLTDEPRFLDGEGKSQSRVRSKGAAPMFLAILIAIMIPLFIAVTHGGPTNTIVEKFILCGVRVQLWETPH